MDEARAQLTVVGIIGLMVFAAILAATRLTPRERATGGLLAAGAVWLIVS